MPKATRGETLLVQLVVDDQPFQSEKKFAQRCRESRDLFRMLFDMKEGRSLKNAGPILAHEASILVRNEEDIVAIERWTGEAVERVIVSMQRIDGHFDFDDEVEARQRKTSAKKVSVKSFSGDEDDSEPGPRGARVLSYPPEDENDD